MFFAVLRVEHREMKLVNLDIVSCFSSIVSNSTLSCVLHATMTSFAASFMSIIILLITVSISLRVGSDIA